MVKTLDTGTRPRSTVSVIGGVSWCVNEKGILLCYWRGYDGVTIDGFGLEDEGSAM